MKYLGNKLFAMFAVPVALIGAILCMYYLTVMFDDKQQYDGGFDGFIKWLNSAVSSEVQSDTSTNTVEDVSK
jgi:hypothetical protein